MFPELGHWYEVTDGDPRASALYERHYSCVNLKARKRNRSDKRICGPGKHIVLMTTTCDALFVWKRCNRPDLAGQSGIYCAIFRNETKNILSSELILEAEQIALDRWPRDRFYTYINKDKIKSANPGYCFKRAGWVTYPETTQNGKIILEKYP